MKILVACEESGRVTEALRERGHDAYSCDIIPTSGGHPEWHIQDDVLKHLEGWDMIIAFPPCTHLAVSGARHFEGKRKDGRQLEAIRFFKALLEAPCDKIAVENPVNIIGSDYIKEYFPEYADLPNCTQYIQPYWFGDPSKKKTCLWLKNLPELKPTNMVQPDLIQYTCKDGRVVTFSKDYCNTGKDRAKNRSKTYLGVAKAMAEQWT